jgi:hypothetical protein
LFRLQQQFLNVALFCILQQHSATLHEVLPISELKIQTAYCNTSWSVVYFQILNTNFTCIFSCHFGTHPWWLIINNLQHKLYRLLSWITGSFRKATNSKVVFPTRSWLQIGSITTKCQRTSGLDYWS